MATRSSLNKCIKNNATVSADKLPKKVLEEAGNGRRDLMEKALREHIAVLRATKNAIVSTHRQDMQEFFAQAVDQTMAHKLVNPDEGAATSNELKKFKAKEKIGVHLRNLVQRTGTLWQAVRHPKLTKQTKHEQDLLTHYLADFHTKFETKLEEIFKVKEGTQSRYRHDDPIQYFAERFPADYENSNLTFKGTTYTRADGTTVTVKVPPVVATAISSVAYDWLGSDSHSALGQTEYTVRQWLGLEKDDPPPSNWGILMGLGVNANNLAETLGAKILQRIGIEATGTANANAQARLELSLGYMGLAVLEEMDILERQQVYTGELSGKEKAKRAANPKSRSNPFEDQKFGIRALKNKMSGITEEQVIYTGEITKEGAPTQKLYRLKYTDETGSTAFSPEVEEIRRLRSKAPHIMTRLFDEQPDSRGWTWEKPKLSKKMKIGRKGLQANKQMQANIQKYSDIEWVRSTATADVFDALDEAMREKILGRVTEEDENGLLEVRNDSNDGINEGIKRDVEAYNEWKNQALDQEKGLLSKFYIPSFFYNNMRMGQLGRVNPQGSKIHRNLFSPKAWFVSFDPTKDEATDQAFHEAIALSLGIESGKRGGVDNQLKRLAELADIDAAFELDKKYSLYLQGKAEALTDAEMEVLAFRRAVNALGNFLDHGEWDADGQQAVAEAVNLFGEKLHTFKGLLEYARYENHEGGLFTTDIYKEIDGVSNGPIIGIAQLIPDHADKQATLATLAMGGLATDADTRHWNLDELQANPFLNDAYQRMGQNWVYQLEMVRQEVNYEEKNIYSTEHMDAIEYFVKKFHEDGVLNKVVRNLSKPRTMQTTYNSSPFTQMRLFAQGDVIADGIYKKLESILHDINTKAKPNDQLAKDLQEFLTNVAIVTEQKTKNGTNARRDKLSKYYYNGEFDIQAIRSFELSDYHQEGVLKAVQATYGKAMQLAIEETYKANIDARAPFLDAVNMASSIYNLVLTKKVQVWEELHGEPITKSELDTILKEIEHLLPKIRTPEQADGSRGYLALYKYGRGEEKKFLGKANVEQNYANKLEKIRGKAQYIPLLAPPGAAPMVRAIQMIDATIANHLMGVQGLDFLNNHDGFSHSIKDSDIIRTEANQRFYDVLNNYSLGEEFNLMQQELGEAGREALEQLDISDADLRQHLLDNDIITLDMLAKFKSPKANRNAIIASVASMKDDIKAKRKASGWKLSSQAATRKYLEENFNISEDGILPLLQRVDTDVKDMGNQTTENLRHFMGQVTHSAQYPDKGRGINVIPKQRSTHVFGIDVNKILSIDAANTERVIKDIQELIKETVVDDSLSSDKYRASTKEQDYPAPQKVNSQNVQQVFESILNLDAHAAHASVQIPLGHKEYLSQVLNQVVSRVMDPVELYMNQHKIRDRETVGLWDNTEGGPKKIWIQTQQLSTHPRPGMLGHGLRMSAAEVYAHELVHHITHTALNDSGAQATHLRRQVQMLYRLAQKKAEDRFGSSPWKILLDNPDGAYDEFEEAAAKDRYNYFFEPKTKEGERKALDEFVAFGITNQNFKEFLGTIKIDDKTVKWSNALSDIKGENLQQTLVNLFNRIMDLIGQVFYKKQNSTKVDQQLMNLVLALTEVDSRAKTSILQGLYNKENTLTALASIPDEFIKKWANKAWSVTRMAKVIEKTKQIPDLDNILSHHMRVALLWYNSDEQGVLPAIVNEMKGTTSRLRPLHDILMRRKRTIDAAKQSVAETMRRVSNTLFHYYDSDGKLVKRELKSHEKTAITKALLKTDMVSLMDTAGTLHGLELFLRDPGTREDRIDRFLADIAKDPVLRPYRHFFENAADDLAYYMITSRTDKIGVPLMNAESIVTMHGTKGHDKLKGDDRAKAIHIVDQLASLMSLRYVRQDHLTTAANLFKENASGIESILHVHKDLKEKAVKNQFAGQTGLMQKGYTKSILNSRIQYKMGTLSEKKKYEDMGYVMQATPLPRDPDDPVRDDIYMFKSNGGTVNDLQSGMLSYTRNSAMGKSMFSVQMQTGNLDPAVAAAATNRRMKAKLYTKLDNMFQPRTVPRKLRMERDTHTNYMIPKMDNKGRINAVRYLMAETTKDSVLQQHSEFDSVLSAMASQIVDKSVTPEMNVEVINALKNLYDDEHQKYPEAYVEISPHSQNEQYREFYMLLPETTKNTIHSVWGEHRMYVAQDVVDLAFGQRKKSITDIFGKDPKTLKLLDRITAEVLYFALGWWNPLRSEEAQGATRTGRAVNRAKTIEDFMVQLTKLGKSNIIVRNFAVTRGNYLSNMAYLKSKGVPLEKIIKLSREAITSSIRYQKTKAALDELIVRREITNNKQSISYASKLDMLKKIDRKIADLQRELDINPSTPMIEAGLMPQIVDDVDTGHVQSPYKYGLDKFIDDKLAMLPGKRAEKVGRALFMTEDTEGFRILNNAVKMTDYVGRYVLYHHYTQKENMTHKDALSAVTEEFVNFDLPTHKTIEHLNQTGLVWFSKYQLRILKHIKNIIKDRPFTSLTTYLLGMFLIGGNNIINSVPGITKDLFQAFGDPLTAAAGSVDEIFNVEMVMNAADITGDVFQ